MLVAYVTNSFSTSGGLYCRRAPVNSFPKPFTLHQLCAGPGCAPELGPRARGVGYPFLGHLLTSHLGEASERLSQG